MNRRRSHGLLLVVSLSFTLFAAPVGARAAGLTKIFLHGSLKEAVGQDAILIPFTPFANGDGPLIKDPGSATVLATAEIVELQNGVASVNIYPVAVSFPLGEGMVYYSSFRIPENLDTVTPGLTAADMPAVRAFAEWFLAKPLANADRVSILKAYGIANADVSAREDTTVDKAKSKGLPVDLTAGADVTVVAVISERVLGKVDYSKIPANYAKHRQWTASLLTSSGRVFAARATSGNVLAFPVKARDNTGGTWRVRVGGTRGFLDKQLFLTMVLKGLRDIDR